MLVVDSKDYYKTYLQCSPLHPIVIGTSASKLGDSTKFYIQFPLKTSVKRTVNCLLKVVAFLQA